MAKLKELKAQFGEGTPAPANGPTPVKGGGGASGGGKLILKTAKGTRDYQPAQMAVREKVNFVIDKNKTQFDVNLYKSLNFYLHKCSNDT